MATTTDGARRYDVRRHVRVLELTRERNRQIVTGRGQSVVIQLTGDRLLRQAVPIWMTRPHLSSRICCWSIRTAYSTLVSHIFANEFNRTQTNHSSCDATVGCYDFKFARRLFDPG